MGKVLPYLEHRTEREPAGLRGEKVRCSIFMHNNEDSNGKILRGLWKQGMEGSKQLGRVRRDFFICNHPEAELIAWVRVSHKEMGMSGALGSWYCVSKGLGGRENCRGLLFLPCGLRGNEQKEV